MTGLPNTPSHPPRPGAWPLVAISAQAGGQAVLTLAGDIDLATAGAVREAASRCLRGQPACLLLDLRHVGFCDAAGARVLRQARDAAAAAGTEFRLIAPGPPVIRVLTLIGAGDLLPAVQYPLQPVAARPASPTRGP